MSNRKTKIGHGKTDIVAIVQQGHELKAVRVAREGRCMSVLWARRSDGGQGDIGRFAVQCGLSGAVGAGTRKKSRRMSVVGFDSSRVMFYRLEMPAVKSQEFGAMVRLQAESRLPLPADQMRLAWKTGRVRDGQVSVTIAAGRREGLEGFVDDVRAFEPLKIVLNCEAVVKAWRTYFSGGDETAVIVNIAGRSTDICLSDDGQLINAVSLDIGMDDLCAVDEPLEQMKVRERFAQDLRSVLELFGYSDSRDVPLFVLSDGGHTIDDIVTSLVSAGINAAVAEPDTDKVTSDSGFGVGELYEYRVPIGLASIALDGETETLDVFDGLYWPSGKKARLHWFRSPVVTGVIAALMLVLLAGTYIAVDVVSEKRLAKMQGTAQFQELIVREWLVKAVARERPDLLELLKNINSVEGNGVMLHGVEFVLGQSVIIHGQSSGDEQVYKFQEKLLGVKGISKSDRPMSMKKEPKGDKYTFTMVFNYKGFTHKGVR